MREEAGRVATQILEFGFEIDERVDGDGFRKDLVGAAAGALGVRDWRLGVRDWKGAFGNRGPASDPRLAVNESYLGTTPRLLGHG